jgi:L-threonylcarbamoyladenylate synthase
MPSPGLLARHYSPRTPLTLYEGDPQRALDRLQADARDAEGRGTRTVVLDFGGEADLVAVAAGLYSAVRDADAGGADLILVRGCAAVEGLGPAIQDRLRRAATRVVTV